MENAITRAARRAAVPVLVGLVGFVVSVVGSWVPSIWYDEAATVTSASRSWAALGREVQDVDVVHATYYAAMHCWFALVGYSPSTLRFPSAVAVGVTAALLVVLGPRLVGPMVGGRLGVLAGLFFTVLPRVTWMGAEGRSFALGTLLATVSTLLLVAAVDRTVEGRRAWPSWVAYTAVSVLGGAVFLYLVLLTAAQGATVLALRRGRRWRQPAWRPVAAWALAAAITVGALVPLAVASSAQGAQISWIRHVDLHTVEEVLVTQFSYENAAFAVLLWVLVAAGVAVGVRVPRMRALLAVAVPWIVVPTVLLVVASVVTHPLYSPRYLAFATPAAALLMAAPFAVVPVRGVRARWASVLAVLLAVGLSAPTWVTQRTVTAKDDSAWNTVAGLVVRQRLAEPVGARDAVLFGPVERHPKATSRIIAETYPRAFAGMRDPLLVTPAGTGTHLWDTQRPLTESGRAVGDATTVWLVTAATPDERPTVTAALRSAGFHVGRQWRVARTWVVRYDR